MPLAVCVSPLTGAVPPLPWEEPPSGGVPVGTAPPSGVPVEPASPPPLATPELDPEEAAPEEEPLLEPELDPDDDPELGSPDEFSQLLGPSGPHAGTDRTHTAAATTLVSRMGR